MKRKLIGIALILTLVLSLLPLTACSPEETDKELMTRVTVDVNPSVEFMVDEDNKVVSVTALNDDAGILIVGEAFIGKTAEEAVELMLSLANDTGYIVSGNVEASENEVKISVSGDTAHAKELLNSILDTAETKLEALDIDGAVKKVDALGREALRELVAANSSYTEEEVAEMDEDELYKVLALGRIETAEIISVEMREAYFYAKDYEISFAESAETAKLIESLGGLYTLTYKAYKEALELYSKAITELDEFRYEQLVSPDSEYQQLLLALREAKVDMLINRRFTAKLEINGEEYASASATLKLSEEKYQKAVDAFEKLGTTLNESLERLITALRTSESAIAALEDKYFSNDKNIKAVLEENAAALETTLNEKKDKFFDEFESRHGEDIESVNAALAEQKERLKNNISDT